MNRICRRSTALLLTAAALSGCNLFTGAVEDFFTLTVVPAPGGGPYTTVQGGQVVAFVRIQNGANVRTEITLLTDEPIDVLAMHDFEYELGPNEVRDIPINIYLLGERPDGIFTVEVTASGESHRTDANDSRGFSQTRTVAIEVFAGVDESPPTVTILDPDPGASSALLPVGVRVSAVDNGAISQLTYQLNDDAIVEFWTASSANQPVTTIERQFDIPAAPTSRGPRRGANTLLVTARDARGNTGSATVDFTYEATGLCNYFHIATSHSDITAAPGENISFMATVTPLGSWTGDLTVRAMLSGLLESGSLVSFDDVTAPVEARVGGQLRNDLDVGLTGHVLVRVNGESEPLSLCEAGVPITIVEPGAGARPQVTIVAPTNETITSSGTVTLTATVTDDGSIGSVSYRRETDTTTPDNFVVTSATPSPFTFSRSVQLEPGDNLIRVNASDNEGRASSAAVTISYNPEGGTQCDNFTVTPSSASIQLSPGESGTLDFVLTRIGGFAAPISLNIVEPFANIFFSSVAFVPNPTTTLGSTLRMTVVDGEAAVEFPGGTFGFTVVARSGASTCVTAFTVIVPAD